MPKNKRKSRDKEALDEWASLLAKKTAEPCASVKEERVAKRVAKKFRREERWTNNENAQSSRASIQKLKSVSNRVETHKRLLNVIGKAIEQSVNCCHGETSTKKRSFTFSSSTKARNVKKSWQEDSVQPRKKDYGGIGLTRPSLYIDLNDMSLVPKLEDEFAEHIPGFFGKQRTKAMKKQLGGNMLWRKLSDSKTKEKIVDGKRLKDMSPDERVEAMLKIGML